MADDNIIQFMERSLGRTARQGVTQAAGANPDEAARALQLSEASGVPAPVIAGDLKNFDDGFRARTAQQIVDDSAFLRNYILANPLNAQLSNDDYGNLADVGDKLDLMGMPDSRSLTAEVPEFAKALGRGFIENYRAEEADVEYRKYKDWLRNNPLFGNIFIRQAAEAAGIAADQTLRLFSGAIGGIGAATGTLAQQAGMPEAWANRLTRDVIQGAQVAMSGQGGLHGPGGAMKFNRAIDPYLKAGKTPPNGIDPVVDRIKVEQAQTDIQKLNELFDAAQRSATRERVPDHFANAIREQNPGEIGISVDAIDQLYGGKPILPDDGILGWVPGIAEKVEAARATGGDVQVPVADWVAKADPAVAKALEPAMRVRPDGMTLLEAAEPKEYFDVWHGSPYEFDVWAADKEGKPIEVALTGEGAASYGHPLKGGYFAEAVGTGESYMGSGGFVDKIGKPVSVGDTAARYLIETKGDYAKARELLTKRDEEMKAAFKEEGYDAGIAEYQETIDALNHLEQQGIRYKPGNLYRVRIHASQEAMLDHDLPISRQPPNVQAGLAKLAEQYDVYKEAIRKDVTGEELRRMVTDSPDGTIPEADAAFSKELKEAGILGIRYLDQGSRPAKLIEGGHVQATGDGKFQAFDEFGSKVGDPVATMEEAKLALEGKPVKETRNFVIFDDKLIEILDRNGEALQTVREAAKLGPTLEEAPPESGAVAKLPGWLPKAQHDKILELIAKRQQSDIEASQKRAERRIRQRESSTWKAKEIETREAVAQEVAESPVFLADTFLREGTIAGKDMPRMKLGERYLTEEQREALPPSFVTKGGEDPNVIATLFGYDNPDLMVADLAQLHRARTDSKKNALAFNRAFVDAEVQRRMDAFAEGEETKILEEAKAQALRENELELLHQEVMAAAIKAGYIPEDTPPIVTRAAFREIIDKYFDSMLARQVDSDTFLRDSGTAGRKITLSAADGKWDELYRQEERRYFAANLADKAIKFEAQVEKFEKLIEKYQKKEFIPTREPSHQNFIHQLLAQAGYKLKISPEQIAAAEEFLGKHSLDDFIHEAASFGEDLAIEPGYKPKPKDQMTVAEFTKFMDAIETLDFVGRESQKIILAGEKMDKAEAFKIFEEHIASRPMLPEERVRYGSKFWGLEAEMTRPEEIIKDLDLREKMGPLFKALIVPAEASKVDEYAFTKRLFKDLSEVSEKGINKEWRQGIEKPIEQDFITDPRTGQPFQLTRWNMIKMMLNWGNKSNAGKLVEGIAKAGLKEGEKAAAGEMAFTKAKIEQLFAQHATKQDWDFVQHIWDIFDKYVPEITKLSMSTSGKVPKFIESQPVLTPFGEYRGGYMPLIPDKLRPLEGHVMVEKDRPKGTGPLEQNFFRATTNQSHLVERTGAKYFVDISNGPEQLIGRMTQVIHDLSWREFAINAGKVLWDPKMERLISDHYGPEYYRVLKSWVKDVVNRGNIDELGIQALNDTAQKYMTNLIVHALPGNINVLASPSLGTANPMNLMKFYWGGSKMEFAMKNSQEVKNALYALDRDMTVALNNLAGTEGWTAFQKKGAEFLMRPLTWFEQRSRAVTFYAEYAKLKAKGMSEADAIIMADSAVRERHTVAHIADMPAYRRSQNKFLKLGTLFMGFFDSQRNWMRQIPESARMGDWENVGRALWGTVGLAYAFNVLLFTKWEKNDDWFKFNAKALAGVPLQMVPYIKGGYDYLVSGQQPREPLAAFAASIAELGKDGWKWATKGQKPKQVARHGANVAGALFGIPGGAQISREIGLVEDIYSGKQQAPRTMAEWMRGILFGQVKDKGKWKFLER